MIDFKKFKTVQVFYKALFYFELGRGSASRFYGWVPEMIIIVGGLKYLLGFNLTKEGIVVGFLIVATLMFFFGLFIKRSGLYDVDRYVQTQKDPVMSEILEGVRRIK